MYLSLWCAVLHFINAQKIKNKEEKWTLKEKRASDRKMISTSSSFKSRKNRKNIERKRRKPNRQKKCSETGKKRQPSYYVKCAAARSVESKDLQTTTTKTRHYCEVSFESDSRQDQSRPCRRSRQYERACDISMSLLKRMSRVAKP